VLFLVRHGSVVLISSEALRDEVGRNPSDERRREGEALVSLAKTTVKLDGRSRSEQKNSLWQDTVRMTHSIWPQPNPPR